MGYPSVSPYPAPSAPPYSSVYPSGQNYSSVYPSGQNFSSVYPSGQSQQKSVPHNQQRNVHQPDLTTKECPFCVNSLKDLPQGDQNTTVVLSRTQCDHFFHEFCLTKYLSRSNNGCQDCPLCRAPVHVKNITLVPVEMSSVAAETESEEQTRLDPRVSAAAQLKPQEAGNFDQIRRIANTLATIFSDCFQKVVKSFKGPSAADLAAEAKEREVLVENYIVSLNVKWNAMPQNFEKQKEDMNLALTVIRSLMQTHSEKALSSVKILADYTKEFEASVLRAQIMLSEGVSKLQSELSEVVPT